MLHGTDFPEDEFDVTETNPSSGGYDVCLTEEWDIAEQYATRFGPGYIYELCLSGDAEIADGEAVRDLLDLDEGASTSDIFHAVDSSLDRLREAGYDAVQYTDQLPGTPQKFTTTRVIQPGVLEIDEVEEV